MSVLKNILTFGASGRIEEKMQEYEALKTKYDLKYEIMDGLRSEINELFIEIIYWKERAIENLSKFKELSINNTSQNQNKVAHNISPIQLEHINKTIDGYQMALNLAGGVSAGVGSAVGAWALVSAFGAASTGTALSTLSGAAATSATLAWFGGGSLASGAGGMAVGSIILGGIVIVPMLLVTGFLSHFFANKKIKEIEAAIEKITESKAQIESNIPKLKKIKRKSKHLSKKIDKENAKLEKEVKWLQNSLCGKYGFLQILIHKVKILLFSVSIEKRAIRLAKLIDTPVIE